VFKKRREVNTSKVQLELGDYDEFTEEINRKETKKAVEVTEKEEETKKGKPKIRKLGKKLVLIETTATPEAENTPPAPPKKAKSTKSKKTTKKLIVLEEDDE
jgi:hypothetical protein